MEPVAVECVVCMEPLSEHNIPPRPITSSCNHKPSVCKFCLTLSIANDLQNKIWNDITCPECPAVLQHEDVRQFADEESFVRYDRHSVRSFTATVPNFIWCLGPRCESGQEHAGGTERPIVVCGTCGFRTCFLHNVAWHQSLSCHEYDLMLADMKNVRSAIEKAGTNRVEEVNDRRAKQEQEGNDERLARQLQAWESQEVDVLFGRYLQTNNGTEALGRAGGCLNNDRAQNGTANTTKQANMKEVGEEPRKFRATITRVALSFALIGGCLWCNEAEIRVALYILLNGHLSSLVPRSWQFRLIQATRSPSGRTQRLRLLLISRLVLQIFTSCYLLSGKYDMGLAISIPIVGYLAGILPGIRLIFLVRCMLFTTPMIFNWAKTWSFRSFQVAILGASITHCLRTDILVHSYLPLWLAALLMILITAGNLFKIVTAMRRGCSAAASSTASLVGGVRPMHRVETDYREIRVFAGVFQTVHQPPRAVRENKAGALQHQRSRLTLSKQEQEAASLETVATISKKCPNHLCGQPIEKLGGCHHMKCSRCKHEFCWGCLADYKTIVTDIQDHHPDCPYLLAILGRVRI